MKSYKNKLHDVKIFYRRELRCFKVMTEGYEEGTKIEETEHPATQSLKQLLSSGQISQDTYNNLLFKFNKLHQAFTQSCSTEEILLRKTRDLNKELKAQKLTIQNSATQQQEHRQTLTLLRQLVTNLQAELDSTEQQTAATKQNTVMKEKDQEKLERKVEMAQEDQRIKLEPQKKQVLDEIKELESSIQEKRTQIQSLLKINQDTLDKIAAAEAQIAEYEKKRREENAKMLEISSNPAKLKQKSNAAEAANNSLLSEEKTSINQLQQLEAQYQTLSLQTHDAETEYQHISNDIDGMTNAYFEMKKKASELESKCDEQRQIRLIRENEKKRVLKQIDEKDFEISGLNTKADTITKDIVRKEKESVKLEEAIAHLMQDKKSLSGQLQLIQNDSAVEKDNLSKLDAQYKKTMSDMEKVIQQLAVSESLNAETLELIKNALQEVNRKQLIHDSLSQKEIDFIQQLSEVSLIRDRKARETAVMKKRTSDARILAQERNLDFLDLSRKLELLQITMGDTSKLYEQVKLERNKHVNTVQTSRQLIVELKEKIRILESETEVLRREFETTDLQVRVQKNELLQAYTRRDATKSDLKKAELKFQELEAKIDFQANETDRLDHVLKNIEDQIATQQGRFADHSEDCAQRQRLLIDKQDNLCILLEQFNKHEEVMRNGELELQKRDEEIKLLNLQLNDFKRQIDLMNRKLPQIQAYQREIDELKMQISKEQTEVDNITKKLEVPDEQERKRSYCGHDFTLKELEDKVAKYEARINMKEQQLWEKRILLRETQDKIAELEKETDSYASRNQSMIAKSGQLRANSMALRRKKMAAESEYSVYQALKGQLEEQKKDVRNEIEEGMRRSSRGEAFDDRAERMIRLHERDIRTASQSLRNPQFADDDDDEENRPRPGREHYDAYPLKDGLSRPYGAFPVFQPAKPSPNLRHYKNETDRPILL